MNVFGTIAIQTTALYAAPRLRRSKAIAILTFCNPTAMMLIGSAINVNLSAVMICGSVRY